MPDELPGVPTIVVVEPLELVMISVVWLKVVVLLVVVELPLGGGGGGGLGEDAR